VRRFAPADSRLCPIDHKGRHSVEEFPKDLLGFSRQRSFPKGTIHQAHPSVAGSLIYVERRMPRAEAWMASLFDVSLRPSEPADQEISEALLGTWKDPSPGTSVPEAHLAELVDRRRRPSV
jgi:hypothetical protein